MDNKEYEKKIASTMGVDPENNNNPKENWETYEQDSTAKKYKDRYNTWQTRMKGEPFETKNHKILYNLNPKTDEEMDKEMKEPENWYGNFQNKFRNDLENSGLKMGEEDKLVIQKENGEKRVINANDFFDTDLLSGKNAPHYVKYDDEKYGAITDAGQGEHYKILGNASEEDEEPNFDLEEERQFKEKHGFADSDDFYSLYNNYLKAGYNKQDAYNAAKEDLQGVRIGNVLYKY